MKPRSLLFSLLLSSACLGAPGLRAQVIDFESIPGFSAPIDGMAISNQYEATFGVSFVFANGKFPYLAKVGAPQTAFKGPNGADKPRANQGVGQYFLTDGNVADSTALPPTNLFIIYTRPVAAASGVILDIDGNERWRVEALGSNGAVLSGASIRLTADSFNAGSGYATPWSFRRAAPDIYRIQIRYVGTKPDAIGLAFDNFSPSLPVAPAQLSVAPTPVTREITLSGTIGAAYRIEFTDSLASAAWTVLTNLTLLEASLVFADRTSSNAPVRFYRAIGL